jgi:CRP/FNR family cyclic AMP-dependent transcriptional regulator
VRPDELLRQHPLFARLRGDQIERFARVGELESFHAGENIVVEGTLGDAVYLVLEGTCEVVKHGRRLALLPPGEFFGEMSLVEPAARSATVIATEPAHLFRLPHFTLQNLLEDDPLAFNQFLVTIVRVLSERLRRANSMIGDVGQLADWLAGSLV